MARVCHITTVHPVFDTRIFHKECKSLVRGGHDVTLIAPHERNEMKDGVRIVALAPARNRLARMALSTLRAFRLALRERASIYHFHDPELIPIGMLLRLLGNSAIYDVHEDVPRDLLTKEWLPRGLRRCVAEGVEVIERVAAGTMKAVVAATPFLRDRFARQGCATIDVRNYPIRDELYLPDIDWTTKETAVCYVGTICEFRGIFTMVEAVAEANCRLLLAGQFSSPSELRRARGMVGWRCVEELGHLDRLGVCRTLARSRAGLAVIHPHPDLINGLLTKMFEYMAAGIPVIASDFPLWREIVNHHACGICVDPTDHRAIAQAIRWILDHAKEARQMGENGRRAVLERYNWERESEKLLSLYSAVMSGGKADR